MIMCLAFLHVQIKMLPPPEEFTAMPTSAWVNSSLKKGHGRFRSVVCEFFMPSTLESVSAH